MNAEHEKSELMENCDRLVKVKESDLAMFGLRVGMEVLVQEEKDDSLEFIKAVRRMACENLGLVLDEGE